MLSHSQEERPRVGHTPGLGRVAFCVQSSALVPGAAAGPGREARARAPILRNTRLQRRPGSLLEKPGPLPLGLEKMGSLGGCRKRSLASRPQGCGEGSVLAQEGVGVEEGPRTM